MCFLKKRKQWKERKTRVEKSCYDLLGQNRELMLAVKDAQEFFHAKAAVNGQAFGKTAVSRILPLDEEALWRSFGSQGRFNRRRIKYPYVAFDQLTAVAETRALAYQNLTIGVYKLKNDLRVINATRIDNHGFGITGEEFITSLAASPCSQNSLIYDACNLCATIFRKEGYDGIIWDSSRRFEGRCLVIFKDEKQQLFDRVQEIFNRQEIYTGGIVICKKECNRCLYNFDFVRH